MTKRFRLLLLAGCMALTLVGASDAGTGRATLVPVDVAFWNATQGLALFHTVFHAGRPVLARTDDGGRSWRVVLRPRSATEVAVALGTRRAWLTEGGCDFWPACRPRLLASVDGGRTWHPRGKAVLGLSFPTATVGFGVLYAKDDTARLFRTGDGGKSWSASRSPPCDLHATAWFSTQRHGWVLCTGQPGAGFQAKGLYRTRNGGGTWALVMNAAWRPTGAPARGAMSSAGYPHGIAFSGARGWVWQSRYRSYTSYDSGRTWVTIGFTRPDTVEIEDVAPVSGRVAYAVVARTWTQRELRRTDDGGLTWRVVRLWRYR